MSFTTETMDKLFLELSQFSQATTARELRLMRRIERLESALRPFAVLVKTTSGRIPHERLSAQNWHEAAKAMAEEPQP